MNQQLIDMIETVHDQVTFVKYWQALRADLEKTERECQPYPRHNCMTEGHWETKSSVLDFFKSGEDWAVASGFGAGEDRGEPVIRTIARILYLGRFKLREDRSDRDDEWNR
jgi:hypothetical protein